MVTFFGIGLLNVRNNTTLVSIGGFFASDIGGLPATRYPRVLCKHRYVYVIVLQRWER